MSSQRDEKSDEPGPGQALPLHQLIYCSWAAADVKDSEVARIVAVAQRMNSAHGITGLLVWGGGMFFQWLEGPREAVLQLMDLIRRDPRHERVVILSETEEANERLFPDWSMERVAPGDIRPVLQDALASAKDAKSAASLCLLLAQFDAHGMGPGSLMTLSDDHQDLVRERRLLGHPQRRSGPAPRRRIDKAAMREVDESCLAVPPGISAANIKRFRE